MMTFMMSLKLYTFVTHFVWDGGLFSMSRELYNRDVSYSFLSQSREADRRSD